MILDSIQKDCPHEVVIHRGKNLYRCVVCDLDLIVERDYKVDSAIDFRKTLKRLLTVI
jgi:hypothetical protein